MEREIKTEVAATGVSELQAYRNVQARREFARRGGLNVATDLHGGGLPAFRPGR